MNKRKITKAIMSNIAICLIAVIFFVSSVFAWFEFVYSSETPNHIFVGNFKVDLRDDPDAENGFSSALNIDLQNMRPMSEEMAYGDLQEHHIYRFQIINYGTVHAMCRFLITAEDQLKNTSSGAYVPLGESDTAKLSRQLKYSMRFSQDLNELLSFGPYDWIVANQFVFNDLLSEEEKEYNHSLQMFFDLSMVSPPGDNDDPPLEGFLGENDGGFGEIKAGRAMFFDICFWLSENATIDSVNKVIDGQKYVKAATITFNAYFMQSIGGAKWPLDWQTSLRPAP